MADRLGIILYVIITMIAIVIIWIARKPVNKGRSKYWVTKSWDPDTWRIRWGVGEDLDIGDEGEEIGKVDRTKDVGKY